MIGNTTRTPLVTITRKNGIVTRRLHEHITPGSFAYKSFVRDAHINKALSGKTGFARVIRLRLDETPPYFSRGEISGKDLKEYLSEKGRLPVAQALKITSEINERVAVLHTLKLAGDAVAPFLKGKEEGEGPFVHRDLAPKNIIITPAEEVFLIDFEGVAEIGSQVEFFGTLFYAAPEALSSWKNKSTLTQKETSDIYSIGVILYEMLTGESLFLEVKKEENYLLNQGIHLNITQLIDKILENQEDDCITNLVKEKELPSEIEELLLRCLKKPPSERLLNTQQLRTALSGMVS